MWSREQMIAHLELHGWHPTAYAGGGANLTNPDQIRLENIPLGKNIMYSDERGARINIWTPAVPRHWPEREWAIISDGFLVAAVDRLQKAKL